MSDTGITRIDIKENVPLFEVQTRIDVPDTPSGFVRKYEKYEKAAGIAFSGGGIRSAAFCSGALRRMLQMNVSLDVYLSCVSGGGYTGAAFLDWSVPLENPREENDWEEKFFDNMRENAGYICNWQAPYSACKQALLFGFVLFFTVLLLPCLLWLTYSFPVAVAVDFLFGDLLREKISCPDGVDASTSRSSQLAMELYENCSPSVERVVLFSVTFSLCLLTWILSRCKKCLCYRDYLRWLSIFTGLSFAFTFFPWIAHDFLWPEKVWIKVIIVLILLIVPFIVPVIRSYAAIFLVFYEYSYIISWKVFKVKLFGQVAYSDGGFYVSLLVCVIILLLFPVMGPIHQTCFNYYYRYRLTMAFFKRKARFHIEDVFPWCVNGSASKDELTLYDLHDKSPTLISNITVNNWHITGDREGESHHLIAFSPLEIKVIGKYVDENGKHIETPKFAEHFEPEHMRLCSAVAISGAAVSFDMGSYENKFDMILDLLSLLGIGMGDEQVSNQLKEGDSNWTKHFVIPCLVELGFNLPLIASPLCYYMGYSTTWVSILVLVHVVIVAFLAFVAVLDTALAKKSNKRLTAFIRFFTTRIFFVRFVRGFLNIPKVGQDPPHVLRLSDGGHFENLALLPLLERKLSKIVIVDGSCNSGGDHYADALLGALRIARGKLHCWFEGMNGRDIEEDIRLEFLTKDSEGKLPRSYRFRVRYCDEPNGNPTGEILFIAPRHPRECRKLKPELKKQPTWTTFDCELDKEKWGEGPELSEDDANRLNWCCCLCCHDCGPDKTCHTLSSFCLGEFPHHITANQFFTPDMFREYHREGYAACAEAKVHEFLPTEDCEGPQFNFEPTRLNHY